MSVNSGGHDRDEPETYVRFISNRFRTLAALENDAQC
jgi:hypothetical protein